MRLLGFGMMAALALVGGCSKQASQSPSDVKAFAVSEGAAAPAEGAGKEAAIKVALPQIAYTYRYGFELPAAEVPAVQQRHVAACDKLGPLRCHVLEMQSGTDDGKATGGSLRLVVDARLARSFGASLATTVASSGGKQSESTRQTSE